MSQFALKKLALVLAIIVLMSGTSIKANITVNLIFNRFITGVKVLTSVIKAFILLKHVPFTYHL